MSGPEFNPADDEQIDREEWEKGVRNMSAQPWYRFRDSESVDEYRDRKLRECPVLSPIQLDVLIQMSHAVWDGYVISKSARDQLTDMGLVTRFNGWQIATKEGLAVLDTLKLIPSKFSSSDH